MAIARTVPNVFTGSFINIRIHYGQNDNCQSTTVNQLKNWKFSCVFYKILGICQQSESQFHKYMYWSLITLKQHLQHTRCKRGMIPQLYWCLKWVTSIEINRAIYTRHDGGDIVERHHGVPPEMAPASILSRQLSAISYLLKMGSLRHNTVTPCVNIATTSNSPPICSINYHCHIAQCKHRALVAWAGWLMVEITGW